ncbi:MAG: hypothetical protein K2N64_07745 [Anaeroplasmataceae bacterium]|nr:hypothetical protein [Anaeroplasmataceae bacterium]
MKYFGTDGIRGIPNEKLTLDLVTRVGMALSLLPSKTVVIATDTRISKDMLSLALASGCLSRGLKVKHIGIVPTPALLYYSYVNKVTGVMITASHNPYQDNGIKISNLGFKLTEAEEKRIENYIDHVESFNKEIGSFRFSFESLSQYFSLLNQYVAKTNLKIAIDCANGATYKTAPAVFSKVSKRLVVLHHSPDGYNINRECGSTHLDSLKQAVVQEGCDIGFAFDGDGDRVLCVDCKGNTIDGDKMIYLFARYLKSEHLLKEDTIVLSKMSNLGLIKDLNRRGIKVIETEVGDKYIISELQKRNLSLGGENSGHIILPDLLHTGDGVLNALYLCQILSKTNTRIEDWFEDLVLYKDVMINIKVKDKNKVLQHPTLFKRIEEMKNSLHGDCKIIVRPSGTEELIRITVMALDEQIVEKYIEELVKLVKESV